MVVVIDAPVMLGGLPALVIRPGGDRVHLPPRHLQPGRDGGQQVALNRERPRPEVQGPAPRPGDRVLSPVLVGIDLIRKPFSDRTEFLDRVVGMLSNGCFRSS